MTAYLLIVAAVLCCGGVFFWRAGAGYSPMHQLRWIGVASVCFVASAAFVALALTGWRP